MNTYTTVQGDLWDAIAYRTLGSTAYTDQLINANTKYRGYFVFPAGIVLTIPEIARKPNGDLPPWKR